LHLKIDGEIIAFVWETDIIYKSQR
jgi:hypothetical protein